MKNRAFVLILTLLAVCLVCPGVFAAEKPNILVHRTSDQKTHGDRR
jgi:hypothetical protein